MDNQGVSYPKVARFVATLKKRPVRWTVIVVWLGLGIGGLCIFHKFMDELTTKMDPVQGTTSYDATNMDTHFFPFTPIQSAILIQSKKKVPFIKFVDHSTCMFTHNFSFERPNNFKFEFGCEPTDQGALGGGCFLKSELLHNISEKIPKMIPRKLKARILEELGKMIPNITRCPVAPGEIGSNGEVLWPRKNGDDPLQLIASNISQVLNTSFPECKFNVTTFSTVPAESFNVNKTLSLFGGKILSVGIKVGFPAGETWQFLEDMLLADAGSTSVMSVNLVSCNNTMVLSDQKVVKDVDAALQNIASIAENTLPDLRVRVSSETLMIASIRKGIDEAMNLSALTLPLALLILAAMIRNIRLVLCTIINLFISLCGAILIMYPIAKKVALCTMAPSMMVAVALAMSVDYSLFLLRRFRAELLAGYTVEEAVVIMLATSGKIVIVSGFTLMLCFLMMLVLPVGMISSLGISAAVTTLLAVTTALTLTPWMLLSFPNFFSSMKNFGFTLEGCCCKRRRPDPQATLRNAQAMVGGETNVAQQSDFAPTKSCWTSVGDKIQRVSFCIILLLVAVAVPMGMFSLPRFRKSYGLTPMMPRDADSTQTLLDLQASFGMGSIYPTTILIVQKEQTINANRTDWLTKACMALQNIATATNTDPTVPPFTPAVFNGAMILDGNCTTLGKGKWSNPSDGNIATKVLISYKIDPFSAEGATWIKRLRNAIETLHDPVVGSMYVVGAGPIQMDMTDRAYDSFPLMIGLMMAVVLIFIGVAFQSIVAPIRAVLCLSWMLVIAFGSAIFTFQEGDLSFLGLSQFSASQSGALFWIGPCFTLPVLFGFGLDYDIFYSERVVEECMRGHGEKAAAVRALAATANTISSAGIIMIVAFLSLLLSSTPMLNEMAFPLTIALFIDCFITTKIIIPAVMAVLGSANFWPRKFVRRNGANGISLMHDAP